MRQTLYLAWKYLAFHRLKTAILVTSISLILFIPVGLRVLVEQSSRQLTARAQSTPLVVGARGSPLELVLNTLYFASDIPAPTRYARYLDLAATGLSLPIPMYVRFEAQGHPIVGTSLDYLEFRGLNVEHGRSFAMLGECVIGSRVAAAMGVGPGDFVVSSPESVFDIAGVYPLRMKVVGVLAFSDAADDDGIFVDLKTAWIIAGLGHGHQDLTAPEAASGVLSRDSVSVTANASVVQYNEITEDNADTFHFHGDLSTYPLTAVIAVPPDQKSSALLQGRFEGVETADQIVRPDEVMGELLNTILTVESFIVAGAVLVGIATAATVALVFMLSLRLRRRERDTMYKIGGSRAVVGFVMASEIVAVLVLSIAIAAVLTLLTSEFGSSAVRALIRM